MDVTVVVPMHNMESRILDCLRSIDAQTARAKRVIVVDDRSTDGSRDIVGAAGLPNVEVIANDSNLGPGATRNIGAAQARTEWIAFLDADDVWDPRFLESVGRAVERFNADFGSSGGIRQLDYREDQKHHVRVMQGGLGEAVDLTDDFWRAALRFMPIHPSSALIRRELFEHVGGYCEQAWNGEDAPLWAELWRNGRFAFVNEALFTSIAPVTGLSAQRLLYRDVRIPLLMMGRTLLRSIRARKRGSGWFLTWWLLAVARRHAVWLKRRLRRRPAQLTGNTGSVGP
jgi:GT2 family glycosyltransferase